MTNTRAEIAQALEDYGAGRLGRVPATELPHRQTDDVDLANPRETHRGETHQEENGERHG